MLEEVLTRIAVALEAIVAEKGTAVPTVDLDKPKRGRPAKEVAPAAPAVEIDPLTGEPVAAPVAAITLDQVRDSLRAHMKVNGVEKTKALMIKFGAPVANPVVTGIPVTNYAALLKECV